MGFLSSSKYGRGGGDNIAAMTGKICVIGIILLIIDGFYIYTVKDRFEKQVIDVQRVIMKIRMEGVIACYILLAVGLYYFILRSRRSVVDAFVLGIIIYGVYDTTNFATLKKWSASFAIIDTLWGGILFSAATFAFYSLGL